MENKEIIEGNRLIAEFMGAFGYPEDTPEEYDLFTCSEMGDVFMDIEADDIDAKHHFALNEMKFHVSWDWLMPVVGKVYEVNEDNINIKFDNIINAISRLDRISAFWYTVEFIKWYNSQNLCPDGYPACKVYKGETVCPDEDENCSLCGGDCTEQIYTM